MEAAPSTILTSREETRELLERALGMSRADQTEIIFEETDSALTRFANNQVHQNVTSRRRQVTVRAFLGPKSGVAGTSRIDDEALRATLERALDSARLQPDDPDAIELPGPAEPADLAGVVPATAATTPDDRATGVLQVTDLARAEALSTAGAFANETALHAVANSRGVFAYFPSTNAHFTCTATAEDSSGWVYSWDRDIRRIDALALGRAAVAKARRSARPEALPAGRYTVVLEEAAVAELVSFLAWLGFGAQQVHEGQSFLTGRIGERITGENITIVDDAFDPRGNGCPFDFEGVPKQRMTLIERGVAHGPVHDLATARKDGVRSTGHASSLPPNPEGPVPFDLVVATGSDTLEDLIASTERGILVTRFWYNRVVDPKKTIVTGMTRDGTFLIEHGQVARGIRNLRFNESVLEVLSRVDGIGKTASPTVFDWSNSCVIAPVMKVRDFQFTGVTEF